MAAPVPAPFELEDELRLRLKGYRVLFEIGLDRATVEAARDCCARIAESRLDPERMLGYRYPAILLTYVVGEANRVYNGTLWPRLPIRRLKDAELKPAVERAMKSLKLEEFRQAADEGLRYVTPVLAHGGIPEFSATDYWDIVLTALDELGGGADAEQLLRFWRRDSNAMDRVDRPVARFLSYGGSVARDFLDRCVDLATATADEADAHFGLPAHIVSAYQRAMEKGERTQSERGPILPAPTIRIEPWARSGPVMELPPVPSLFETGAWLVAQGDQSETFRASRRSVEAVSLKPAAQWTAEFVSDALSRTHMFEGTASGLLLFDPRSGQYQQVSHAIEMEQAWMLAAPGASVHLEAPEGTAMPLELVETLPRLGGAWGSFRFEHVKFGAAAWLVVSGVAGNLLPQVRAQIAGPASRPTLAGAPLAGVTSASGLPVFGRLPDVLIPDLPGVRTDRWSVTVRAGAEAEHSTAAALGGGRKIDLTQILPRGFLGDIQLRVRGPLGRDLKADVGLVPELAVELPPDLILPGIDAEIIVAAANDILLNGTERGALVVKVPSEATHAPVHLERGDHALDIRIAVPKVMWAALGRDSTPVAAAPLELDLSDLRRRRFDELLVVTQRAGIAVELWVETAAGPLGFRSQGRTIGDRGWWRFPLGDLIDSIAATSEPVAALRLRAGRHVIDIGRVASAVDVEDFAWRIDGVFVRLGYREERLLRGRVGLLWPLDRVWDDPARAHIPDGSRGEAFFETTAVPPGAYRAQITCADDWVEPERPRRGARSTAELLISGTPFRNGSPLELLGNAIADRNPAGISPAQAQTVNPVLIAALTSYLAESGDDTERATCAADIFFRSPVAAYRAVAAAVSDGHLSRVDVTRLALLRLGSVGEADLDEELRRLLWPLSPNLAAAIDVPAARAGNREAIRWCSDLLGWTPDTGLPIRNGPIPHQWVGMPTEAIASLDAKRDQTVPVLSQAGYANASVEWATQAQTDARPLNIWLDQHRYGMPATPASEPVQSYVQARAPSSTGWSLLDLPGVMLSLADAARAGDGHARAALAEAAEFAPRLVEHDACLVTVLAGATQDEWLAANARTDFKNPARFWPEPQGPSATARANSKHAGPSVGASHDLVLRRLVGWYDGLRARHAFFLFSPDQLAKIAQRRPHTMEELSEVLVAEKVEAHGREILATVALAERSG